MITANSGAVEINHTSTASGNRALTVTTTQNGSFGIDATNSGTGVAIRAQTTNTANTFAALQAETNSSTANNSAILGSNSGAGYGISGQIPSTATGTAAVYGNNLRTTAGHGILGNGFNGVVGEATNGGGFGVYGANASVSGLAIGTYGIGINGIFGQVTPSIPSAWAGYFTFDIGVEGTGLSTGGWNTVSDIRLKSNIVPIESALDKLMLLRGTKYVLTTPSSSKIGLDDNRMQSETKTRVQYGVIAQEVEAVFPEMIYEKAIFKNQGDDTVYKSVNYDALVPVLIEAVKELKQEVDALKEEIEQLRNQE